MFYNGIDVLKRARYRTVPSDAHGITWSCASEFNAAFSSEISFMEEGAFLSLPNPISRTGVRFVIFITSMVVFKLVNFFRTLGTDGNLKSKLYPKMLYYFTIQN